MKKHLALTSTFPCLTLILVLLATLLATGAEAIELQGHEGKSIATATQQPPEQTARSAITIIDPPELEFFSKELVYQGIPIKVHAVVSDAAMFAAAEQIARMLANLPTIAPKLVAAKVEIHIIGKDQVTTDLPEWRKDKGKPLPEYNGLTRDERTRGMGGRLVSCGEENLLKLENDRWRDRNILNHEFAHVIRNYAMPAKIRALFDQQYERSLKKGLWVKSYASTNPNEFFAELTMWYFGARGDLAMTGPKPKNGREGLKKYDPEAFALFDDFYSGRITMVDGKVNVCKDK